MGHADDETDARWLLSRLGEVIEDRLNADQTMLPAWQAGLLQALLDGQPGPIETNARGDVGALVTEHPMGEVLAEMAYQLARTLDTGAGLAVAAVNRELRETLNALAEMGVGTDDLADDLSDPTPGGDVPAEVRDPEDT